MAATDGVQPLPPAVSCGPYISSRVVLRPLPFPAAASPLNLLSKLAPAVDRRRRRRAPRRRRRPPRRPRQRRCRRSAGAVPRAAGRAQGAWSCYVGWGWYRAIASPIGCCRVSATLHCGAYSRLSKAAAWASWVVSGRRAQPCPGPCPSPLASCLPAGRRSGRGRAPLPALLRLCAVGDGAAAAPHAARAGCLPGLLRALCAAPRPGAGTFYFLLLRRGSWCTLV